MYGEIKTGINYDIINRYDYTRAITSNEIIINSRCKYRDEVFHIDSMFHDRSLKLLRLQLETVACDREPAANLCKFIARCESI